MHYANPRLMVQDVFDDDERPEGESTKWIDLLEGRMEPELPNHYETLIAKFACEVEEERGRTFTKWRFSRGVNHSCSRGEPFLFTPTGLW